MLLYDVLHVKNTPQRPTILVELFWRVVEQLSALDTSPFESLDVDGNGEQGRQNDHGLISGSACYDFSS